MADTQEPAAAPAPDATTASSSSEQKTTEEQPVPEDTPAPNNNNADSKDDSNKKDAETATDATGESEKPADTGGSKKDPIVSSSKKSRPPYKYDPEKITLRFLFANRDGLTVTIECNPSDTVGEVKAALISVWPSGTCANLGRKSFPVRWTVLEKLTLCPFVRTDLNACSGGDALRLVCMGKGYLMPDTRTLEDCQIPVFKTHPTPINVSVKPEDSNTDDSKPKKKKEDLRGAGGSSSSNNNAAGGAQVDQGCTCVIL